MRRLTVALILCAVAGRAGANGAFPDSLGLFLPVDRPDQIALGTNFGLILSGNGGSSWSWVCEKAVVSFATLYQQGPPPDDAFYAVSTLGLVSSHDNSCSWQLAGGTLGLSSAVDVFPDPSDAQHVVALATEIGDGGASPVGVYESTDGGLTFGPALLVAERGDVFTGIEIARSSPATWYVTYYNYAGPTPAPFVARTSDGGAHFERVPQPSIGGRTLRLAAIDPDDAQTFYLRLTGATGDSLALSHDGGTTLTTTLDTHATMSAFLRRADKSIVVGTREGTTWHSSDGGATFSALLGAAHLRALAERDGVLYGAGDNFNDHFAVARSSDGGATWQPLFTYDQLTGPLQCGHVAAACADSWDSLQTLLGLADGGTADAAVPLPPSGDCQAGPPARAPLAPAPAVAIGVLAALGALWLARRRTRRR